MKGIETILTQPAWQSFGWALLHFLWQGTLVASLLAGALRALRGRSSGLRYALSCAALSLMLVAPLVTFWKIDAAAASSPDAGVDEMTLGAAAQSPTRPAESGNNLTGRASGSASVGATGAALPSRIYERLEVWLPWLVLVWLVGVLLLSVRLLGGLFYTRRLTRREARPVEERLEACMRRLARQLRVKRAVRLLESSLVRVPSAIGWLRPVILLPTSSLVGMTPQQLEAILAHELAHVRRHDYLVNLLQTIVETLLFYHPAVWWVSRQVRIEREHACDDLAVALCGDALVYARALTKVEHLRKKRAQPQLSVAANGGELLSRIRRLVGVSDEPRRNSPVFVAVVVAAVVLTSVAGVRAVLSEKRRETARAGGEKKGGAVAVAAEAATENVKGKTARAKGQSLPPEVAALVAQDETSGEDAEVRRVALEALGSHAGTVVVMDARTGRIHAVVNQDWALRRAWRPASIMKLTTALAGVGERLFEPDEPRRVSAKEPPMDLTRALAVSNNPYFRLLGERVGGEHILDYARRLGFGEATGINYERESAGRLPPYRAAGANAGRLGAYGEGVEATPVQLAALAAAIANGGTLVVPRVARTPQERAQFAAQVHRRVDIPRDVLQRIAGGMRASVNYGSGKGASNPSLAVAGKTGTVSNGEASTGLFISYAPAEDARLVVVVGIRGEDESGPVAAGIAGAIYRALDGRF